MKAPTKAFSVWSAGCSLSALLLPAVAGVSETNCHYGFLDLHTVHYDIMLGEGTEMGKDRFLQCSCDGKDKQTQNEADIFPFNCFKLRISPTSNLFSN